MKHLKYYKLFESKTNLTKRDVEDCFVDLTDRNFNVEITPGKDYAREFFSITIELKRINRYILNRFLYSDVADCLMFAIPYIMENFNITSLKIGVTFLKFDEKVGLELFNGVVYDGIGELEKFTNEKIDSIVIIFENKKSHSK